LTDEANWHRWFVTNIDLDRLIIFGRLKLR